MRNQRRDLLLFGSGFEHVMDVRIDFQIVALHQIQLPALRQRNQS